MLRCDMPHARQARNRAVLLGMLEMGCRAATGRDVYHVGPTAACL